MMAGNGFYTEHAEELLYQFDAEEQADCEYQDVLNILNDEFRTFGDALSAEIKKVMPADSEMDPAGFLKQKSDEKGIRIASYNTYNNWFRSGLRPKKSEQSRETMYKIAFALDFDERKTNDLFHKAYLDRAFNYRSYKEVIYHFCLRNRLSWPAAQEAVNQIKFVESDITDQTIRTMDIKADMEKFQDISSVVQYIVQHPHNFLLNNVMAKDRLQYYLEQAKKDAREEIAGAVAEEYYRNTNRNSTNFLFSVITGRNLSGMKGTVPLSFKGKEIPNEIKSNFPSPGVFSAENPSYEEIRKALILMFSYDFWYKLRDTDAFDAFDDYYAQINYELNLIGYPEMYYGNPYDWLFLYCAFTEMPLDTFRAILDVVLE